MNRILATCLAGIVITSAASAAQIILPKRAGTNIATTGVGGTSGTATVSVPTGQSLTFDVEYSVNGVQNGDESGLGLKVRYNSAFFQDATISSVTNLFTKCMIAAPSPQTTSVGGYDREVVFGWLDTSIRRTSGTPNGAVGWPAQADPTAVGDECLDPGNIANDTGVQSTPKVLFTISLQSKPGLALNTASQVSITSDGNVSYAKSSGVTEAVSGSLAETSRIIEVRAAAAPICNLDVDLNGTISALSDGLIIQRALNVNLAASTLEAARGSGFNPTQTGSVMRALIQGFPLDVDGSGATGALTDGLMIRRALNVNLSEAAITAGISTTKTGRDIRKYLNDTCGTSLPLSP